MEAHISVWLAAHDARGNFLFLRRAQQDVGRYNFPGGKLQAHEDTSTATIRETREETGMLIHRPEFDLTISGVKSIAYFYCVDLATQPSIHLNSENDRVVWCNLIHAVQMPLHRPTREYVRRTLAERPQFQQQLTSEGVLITGTIRRGISEYFPACSAHISSSGKVTEVVVRPRFRGRGFAQMLLHYMIAHAQITPTQLVVVNPALVPFYQQFGFTVKSLTQPIVMQR